MCWLDSLKGVPAVANYSNVNSNAVIFSNGGFISKKLYMHILHMLNALLNARTIAIRMKQRGRNVCGVKVAKICFKLVLFIRYVFYFL